MIFDPMSEYIQGVVFDSEDRQQFLEFWQKRYRRPFRLIYRPLQPQQEIEFLAQLIYALGSCTFVVEEIDCFCTPYQISDNFAGIVQRGRHRDITLIGVTQRPFGINRLLTSQAKEIYIFRTNEPRDREYLRNLLGQVIEEKLDQLQQYQYVYWSEDSDKLEIGKA